MPYFKLIILAVTAANFIAAQSIKNGELQISDVNSESGKEVAKNEIQKDVNVQRKQFMKPAKYPYLIDVIKQQQNPDVTDILYNERKHSAAIPPPLLQFLYSHGTLKFPNTRTKSIPHPFPPQTRFPNPQQPNTVAGFLIAYSPTQTNWNSVPIPRERISDEQLDPLAVEESQVFIEIAQPQTGYQPTGKQSQFKKPVGGQIQIESEEMEVPVQYTTSTNSAKTNSKTNRLGDLTNSELQPTAGVQQQPVVTNTVATLQQQPRAVVNRVGSLQQQQPNVGTVQRQQIAVGNTVNAIPYTSVGRSGAVAIPQHPPAVSGFPTFSISFDPLNFLLSLLKFLPIPKLNLDGRTFFGIELKKGFNFPPEHSGSAIQIGQQQPYRRGAVINLG